MSDIVAVYLAIAAPWAVFSVINAWRPEIFGVDRKTAARLALLTPLWPLVVIWSCVLGVATLVRWAR